MVKFLSGGQYTGAAVGLCTFWRTDVTTDKEKDFAPLTTTNVPSLGSCIANTFFKISDISCFNAGNCNGEGKCLPCTKYKYGGMRLAISHSPPLDFLKQFQTGLSDASLQDPQQKFTGAAINTTLMDQLPMHIVVRNIQAQIAKCCHWNAGDGVPGTFYLAQIKQGTETVRITDANGNEQNISGIRVLNAVFPDQAGSFFPVGTSVIAGFQDQPSFYLEPRTGLIKPGENIIFSAGTTDNSITRAKSLAASSSTLVLDTVAAINGGDVVAHNLANAAQNFYNKTLQSNDPDSIASAKASLDVANANASAADAALSQAQSLQSNANSQTAAVQAATNRTDVQTQAQLLAATLTQLSTQATNASNAAGGTVEAQNINQLGGALLVLARQLQVSAFGAFSKCEFFFQPNNVAAVWNSPTDGTLPCNGVRTTCQFYTGPTWQFATDDKMELGQQINAEQLQELRFYSDDWSRFADPFTEFENRFSVPYIWAFKGYVDVVGTPAIQDMILYKPKILFARGTSFDGYQTIQMEEVQISDFTTFAVQKTQAQIQPGSPGLDLKTAPPQYPTIITQPGTLSNARLKITHPRFDKDSNAEFPGAPGPFVLRSWSEGRNTLVLFGTATPNSTVYLINNTALSNRAKYQAFYGTQDLNPGITPGVPGAPDFTGTDIATALLALIKALNAEKGVNDSRTPLGFDQVSTDQTGFWQSINNVGLIYNQINEIYAFVFLSDTSLIFDVTLVDYRLLHAVITQTVFNGIDFAIADTSNSSVLGSNAGFTAFTGKAVANPLQTAGSSAEIVNFSYGYYAWRFIDRGLRAGTVKLPSDIVGQTIADAPANLVVLSNAASQFVASVTSQVVQYRKTISLTDGWYLIDDCGHIMVPISDLNANRVMPLPNQQGNPVAFTNVLTNGGSRGSSLAQWAIESATLTINNETKNLVQFYRNADGRGLPANFVVLGPSADVTQAFGRPKPGRDTITIKFTFLQAQTCNPDGSEAGPVSAGPLVGSNQEVVTTNFYGDKLHAYSHAINFANDGTLTAGGVAGVKPIVDAQQEYVWVLADSEGRPIGKKYTRLMVEYYNLSCIPVEIYYSWNQACTRYALFPDLNLAVGDSGGTLTVAPKAVTNTAELTLGARISQTVLGQQTCNYVANCGDHEFLDLGPLLSEFEVIVFGDPDPNGKVLYPGGKAFYPSAGQAVPNFKSNQVRRPGDQWLRKRGPLWYPYTLCEPSRYNFITGGPYGTDSTELINQTIQAPGINSAFLSSQAAAAAGGSFGLLEPRVLEAYRGPDSSTPEILDTHPDLNNCSAAFTYGNTVTAGNGPIFAGYARKRGVVDPFWYVDSNWTVPPFGNFGRDRMVFEVTEKRGDYLGGQGGSQVAFRWMPMFPLRDDIGSNQDILSEDMEPQHYRLIATLNPAGPIAETPNRSRRFTHKALVAIRNGAAIEYPYTPYWQQFLPDASLGVEPEQRSAPLMEGVDTGPITTMWAWRERDKPITRGVNGTPVLKGIRLALPDYVLDNRVLEVNLRPPEGNYNLTITGPTYDSSGNVATNATIALGGGPPRQILIDFKNQLLRPLSTSNTVYDTSLSLGDGPFPCADGTRTDNLGLASTCSCILNINDPSLQNSNKLPSRFTHLDQRAPSPGFVALYSTTSLSPPIASDFPNRTVTAQPCCICEYYIRGIFFEVGFDFLPTVSINPVFDSRASFVYAWSRIPHGTAFPNSVGGLDGSLGGFEVLSDSYRSFSEGQVFTVAFSPTDLEIGNVAFDVAAFFPSPVLAQAVRTTDNNGAGPKPIVVNGILFAGDPKLQNNGIPALPEAQGVQAGFSNGEAETIVMDLLFDTYVKITSLTISFAAGKGMQVPKFHLGIVDPVNRVGTLHTARRARIVGDSIEVATGLDLGISSATYSTDVLNQGRAIFRSSIFPAYTNTPFWGQFGQEFHIIFDNRDPNYSMGIISIQLQVDAVASNETLIETIFIPDRKYYTSTSAPPAGENPERFLAAMDSATAYWRTTDSSSNKGGNRFRAYSWTAEIQDNQPPLASTDVKSLEKLQEQEYDTARDLMNGTYGFTSFVPFDEQDFLTFLGEGTPSWALTMTSTVRPVGQVSTTQGQLVYGTIPVRNTWNPPGHGWTWNFDPDFQICRLGGPFQMIFEYEFAHFHDNLQVVSPAKFWDELPSGFGRIFGSTMYSPDPSFQAGATGGATGQNVAIPAASFNNIDPNTLVNAGFRKDPSGTFYLVNKSS